MSRVKEYFDMVIIDTPPIGVIVDAAVIASYADAGLMVVGANMLSQKDIRRNIQIMKNANENFLGVVLNKAKDKKDTYGGYGGYVK